MTGDSDGKWRTSECPAHGRGGEKWKKVYSLVLVKYANGSWQEAEDNNGEDQWQMDIRQNRPAQNALEEHKDIPLCAFAECSRVPAQDQHFTEEKITESKGNLDRQLEIIFNRLLSFIVSFWNTEIKGIKIVRCGTKGHKNQKVQQEKYMPNIVRSDW